MGLGWAYPSSPATGLRRDRGAWIVWSGCALLISAFGFGKNQGSR